MVQEKTTEESSSLDYSHSNGIAAATHRSPSQVSQWPAPVYYQTLILGAGFSGLCMAAELKRKGYGDDFLIIDRDSGVGGTWHANTFPGAGADVPSPWYSLSFRQKVDWSTFFPKQPELKAYIDTVVAEYDLQDRLHLQTVVKEARFDESTNLWHIYSEDLPDRAAPGTTPSKHHFVCKFFVSAVGGLSEPNACNIPGHEKFKGKIFHSARWGHSLDLSDKNVVVVGNGSTATQFVPHLANSSKSVVQFVRAKHWYFPQPPSPFAKIPGWGWLVRFAIFKNLQRFLIFAVMESHFRGTLWYSWIGRYFRWSAAKESAHFIKTTAPKEYWDHLIPDRKVLPPMHKRRIIDDGYIACLNKPNVRLELEHTASMEEDCIVTNTGKKVPADVVILATGFTTSRAGFPMELYGRNGEEVHEHWEKYADGGPIHYRSTFLAGYPSLAALNGTNSATGHTSLILASENQVMLALEVAKPLLDGIRPSQSAIDHDPSIPLSKSLATFPKTPAFEVSLKAEIEENYWIQWLMKYRVFHPSHGCGSWYIDKTSGRVVAMHPASQVDLMIRCMVPNWSDYVYTGLPGGRRYPEGRAWWKVALNKLGVGKVRKTTPEEAGLKDYGV